MFAETVSGKAATEETLGDQPIPGIDGKIIAVVPDEISRVIGTGRKAAAPIAVMIAAARIDVVRTSEAPMIEAWRAQVRRLGTTNALATGAMGMLRGTKLRDRFLLSPMFSSRSQ